MKAWQHFKTITKHRITVMKGCFRVGLYWQGLTHDLSKYTPVEFWNGARFYQGIRSPNAAERDHKGHSEAWMHHKGRNRHHYEYWTDLDIKTRQYKAVPMPRKYLVESVMDRRAASMTYLGGAYTDGSPYAYFERSMEKDLMHPSNSRELEFLLKKLRDEGEEALFAYLKNEILQGKPFPWEE